MKINMWYFICYNNIVDIVSSISFDILWRSIFLNISIRDFDDYRRFVLMIRLWVGSPFPPYNSGWWWVLVLVGYRNPRLSLCIISVNFGIRKSIIDLSSISYRH